MAVANGTQGSWVCVAVVVLMTLLWVYCSVSPYRKRLNGLIDLCFALVQCSLIPCISPRGCTGHFGGYLCSVDSQRPSDNPHYRQHKLEAS